MSTNYANLIRENILNNYKGMFRESGGAFTHPFISPGSSQYSDQLWDWDSWLTNTALRQISLELNDSDAGKEIEEYEKGCVLNFMQFGSWQGWLPVGIWGRDAKLSAPENPYSQNMRKPTLAQHAAFITQCNGGDAEWIRESFYHIQAFVNMYSSHFRHKETGLYFWHDDSTIGVDDDPCTWYRPAQSSGSIYLNCLMYKELCGVTYLAERLGMPEVASFYERDANKLKEAINEHCWDERDGFYYSVDLNLMPIEHHGHKHIGYPRDYDCLIQRIEVWSGFLALWAGIATPERAKRVVEEHFSDPRTFNANYGVRTLSKMEKMYNVRASGNPSTWRGPVWGASNYLVFSGLVKYGFDKEAKELAEKTIMLFGKDVERFGAMHEYYEPDTGEPILNRGFQNWNYLVLNRISWLEGRETIREF